MILLNKEFLKTIIIVPIKTLIGMDLICTLLIVSFLPIISFGQFTYIPDNNFEQHLINQGFDFVLDDTVLTQNIDTITYLYIPNKSISDLTGIEDFIALKMLFCQNNQITSLYLVNNTQLIEVSCGDNQLTSVDLRNGNNQNLWYFSSINNPTLSCIDVNDIAWADYYWAKDPSTIFSNDCNATSIREVGIKRKILKVIDILGRQPKGNKNGPLFYIYNDGTIDKLITIE